MTLAERRAAVRAALIEDPCRSDRRVAAEVGCSRELVAIARRHLEAQPDARGDIEHKSISRAVGSSPVTSQEPFWALRRGRDEKTYRVKLGKGRRKTRIQRIRERLMHLLRDVRDSTTVAEIRRADPGQLDSLGRLSLELAAAVARIRRDARGRVAG